MTDAPGAAYGAIVADPPWTYTFASRKSEIAGTGWRGDAGNHYPTMTLDAIKALPVDEWAADNSMLWLWAVNPLLPKAFDVMAAWGFEYKTTLTWGKLGKNGKPAFGMGYWLRGASEHVLIGVRGHVKPQVRNAVSWFTSERLAHSEKPDCVQELVERYTPGPYLEMFARRRRPGWDAWGDEIGDTDVSEGRIVFPFDLESDRVGRLQDADAETDPHIAFHLRSGIRIPASECAVCAAE